MQHGFTANAVHSQIISLEKLKSTQTSQAAQPLHMHACPKCMEGIDSINTGREMAWGLPLWPVGDSGHIFRILACLLSLMHAMETHTVPYMSPIVDVFIHLMPATLWQIEWLYNKVWSVTSGTTHLTP